MTQLTIETKLRPWWRFFE